MTRKAVVLLSGGLDSATTLAIARREGFQTFTLSFDYGQRHRVELGRAREISASLGAREHEEVRIDLRQFGGSALTDSIAVPTHRSEGEIASGIPVTYVPARNTIFLAFCLAYAEVKHAADLFLGVNAIDYSGYPDCRPEFIAAFERLANLATRAGVEGKKSFKIHTPLIRLTKSEIIKKGLELGVDYGRTHSCYDPGPEGLACGVCDSCLLRLKGFREAGVKDPIPYRQGRAE
ncbi:MAG: 7-cyano-7-deazaguanine synthase QueC [Nitrospinaceae bacterium]